MKKQLIYLTFASLCIIAACKKTQRNNSDFFELKTSLTVEEKKFNEQINLATTAVNKLLNIESFRVYCKKEVLKEFDGDYNFLLSKLVKDYGEKINSPVTLLNNLKSNNEYRLEEWPQELLDVINDTYQNYPLTQISIQVDPLAWDPYAYTPNVVYLDATYDESDTDFVNGYDSNGSPIQVNARIEPQLPVVILSTNERG